MMANDKAIADKFQRLVGAGYRLLQEGEPRQEGDEFIIPDTDGTTKYWPWDGRADATIQGPIGPCFRTRRKIANEHVRRDKRLEQLTKKELIELIKTIRPKADAYDRVLQTLGIDKDILEYVERILNGKA